MIYQTSLLAIFCLFFLSVSGTELSKHSGRNLLSKDHKYNPGDDVPLWAAKVGPFSNPSETYEYYKMPFCKPKDGVKEKKLGMGEVVDANRMYNTPYAIPFAIDVKQKKTCTMKLDDDELTKFRKAIKNDWYFQLYFDDLPAWGFLGKMEKIIQGSTSQIKHYLFTHVNFEIKYNGNRVIEINIATDPNNALDISNDLTTPIQAEFSYSVRWVPSTIKFENRLARYERFPLNPVHLEIHWFSVVNSCVTVLLLTGFLLTILMRVLKSDFIKYNDEEIAMDEDEFGWKYIHGEVFRFPANKGIFCALIGTGYQLLVLSLCVFTLALVGTFYPYNRGSLYTAIILLYAITAGVAGYVAASYFRQMGGEFWVRNILITCCIFCVPFLTCFSFLNTVAIVYRSTAALPFGTIVVIVLLWSFLTIPLTILGGIAGKNSRTEFFTPCRTNKYVREIPQLPWYRRTLAQMILAGFLPFSAIYVELYYIFASVWGHKIYVIWSILFIVFAILLIVTAFVTIALTYFQLAVEDHRWWWRSFLCGGSTGFFVYGYCIYYYQARSDMSGFMQASFFFGYMMMTCYAFFLMLGTVGWRSSLLFVRHIYRAIKCE